jgi:hypothetical protein
MGITWPSKVMVKIVFISSASIFSCCAAFDLLSEAVPKLQFLEQAQVSF